MSASAIPPDARSSEQPPSSSQPLAQPLRLGPHSTQPNRLTDTPRARRPLSASHAARGESISLARRAAAVAKKKRERARAHFEQQGFGTNLDNVLRDYVAANASTRQNVSQTKAKRQKRIKWTPQEVDALRCGVQKYGEGRWAVILRENADLFNPVRISVDLKDKWRNLSKSVKTADKQHSRASSSVPLQSTPSTCTPASTPRMRSEPSLPIPLRSTAGPSIVQPPRVSQKLAFPSLPAIQIHRSHAQRSLLHSKQIEPELVSPMAGVRRAQTLPQTHHSENLPVYGYHQMVRSRPFQEPNESIRASNLSGFHLHSSPGMAKNPSAESRPMAVPIRLEHRSLISPGNVSLLSSGGGAPHDPTFARSLEERTLPHVHPNFGPRADQRASDVIHHASAVHPIRTSHPQQFEAVSHAYSSSALHISQELPVSTPVTQRSYGMNREERLQPVRFLGAPIHQGHTYPHQPVVQNVVTESNQFRPLHSMKERNISEPTNEIYPVPSDDNAGQDISSRYARYIPREPRPDSQRDVHVPRPNRQSLEEVAQNHRGDVNHQEHSEVRNLRDSDLGPRGRPRMIVSESLDGDTHLRATNSENRFTHHQTEDEQDHYIRASGNDVQFGSRQGDGEAHQRTSSPSDSQYSQDDHDINRSGLDHSVANIHMGVGDQQPALVQTGTGECIHNEDSMHQVEVPREVLDNDDDDADDDHISHPHTDPNGTNLYHANDDEDDQLTPHHPFSLVNHDVGPSEDGEARDDSHTLGLSEPQQGIDLQVRLVEEPQDCYVPERPRSPSMDLEQRSHGQHLSPFSARDEKMKSTQLGVIVESQRAGHSLGQGRDRGAPSGPQRAKSEKQITNNLSRSGESLRFTDRDSPDNCTGHGGFYAGRDDENGYRDRRVIARIFDKDPDVHQLDSSARERSVAGEINELPGNGNGMISNESEFMRKRDFKEENEEIGNDRLDGTDTRGMLAAGAYMNRDGMRRGSPLSQPAGLRLHNSNEEDSTLDVQNRSSFDGKNVPVNPSSSDSSREVIPLVNAAHTFKVKRIKPITQRREKVLVSEGQGGAERELPASLRRDHGVPIEHDKSVMRNRKADTDQEGCEENSLTTGGRHRVEAGASLANLLNPTSLDCGPGSNAYNRRRENDAKDLGSHELSGLQEE